MAQKQYEWEEGATLEEHTRKKHKVLREYFRQYLITHCQLPQQERFRLAVVDGFSGGGLYSCGSYGSPIIFVTVLVETVQEINLNRISQGIKPISIECLLIFNDKDRDVVNTLRKNLAPHLAGAKATAPNLIIKDEYHSSTFESIYPSIKARLNQAKCSNVFFNLDQCGYSHVTSALIRDVMISWSKAEVFLTFMISSMLAYLSPKSASSNVPLEPTIQIKINDILKNNTINKAEWLGEAEKIAHCHLRDCAPFVSPFSINNPTGWQYWLMHFANVHKARQVYNNILHDDPESQAHYGKSGLHMLSYTPQDKTQLYLFDSNSRESAKASLYDDIPRLVAKSGDTLSVEDFYSTAYSETPAHSDDIHEMIIANPDLEVLTETGGKRQKANTIRASDTLKLINQKSFFFTFSD